MIGISIVTFYGSIIRRSRKKINKRKNKRKKRYLVHISIFKWQYVTKTTKSGLRPGFKKNAIYRMHAIRSPRAGSPWRYFIDSIIARRLEIFFSTLLGLTAKEVASYRVCGKLCFRGYQLFFFFKRQLAWFTMRRLTEHQLFIKSSFAGWSYIFFQI